MKKFLSKCGYAAYQCTPAECVAVTNGLGVCDFCTTLPKQTNPMYIVPVLNGAMCEHCFKDWEQRAVCYDEDLEFEKQAVAYIDEIIKKHNIKLEDINVK